MISRLPLVCLVLCALVAALPARAESPDFQYGLSSGVVEYQVTTTGRGLDSTGTDTLWFTDKGRKSARLQKHTPTRSKTGETEMLNLLVDGWVYNLDLKKKTGMRMSLEQAKRMAEQAGMQGMDKGYAKDFIEKNGGRMLPPEEFLGRTCEVFEFKGFKTWAYKGVALKTEGTMMGMKTSMVATRIEENASIPASRFDIPKDIKVEDMPDLSAMFGGLMSGRSPAGAGDEADAPRKPNKPAPRKPVVEEPMPDAPPPPVVKPKPLPKPAPKPAPKLDGTSVRLSFEEFREIAGKLHVPGYTTMAPESAGGGHLVNLIDTRGGALGVTILPLAIADGLEKSEALKVDSKFDHQGHAAIAGVLVDKDEGDSSIVLVRYPERKLAILVSGTPVKPKEELLKLLEQIDL